MLDLITALILTHNEEPNIARALDRLSWARQILVIDSFSSDKTCDIARSNPRVRLLQRPFDNHTSQWNFGLAQISTLWALSLDSDYILPDDFPEEISRLRPSLNFRAS